MSYQQSSFQNPRVGRRSGWRSYPWSNPTQIQANQQGIVTQEQRNLLDKGPGCLSTLVFCLFVFGIMTSCITVGVVIYLLFAGKFTVFGPDIIIRLALPFVLTPILGRLSSILRRVHNVRFTRDISALLIERVQGEVVWENGQYVARTPNFRLKTTPKSPPLPPPGPYHFYYVAGQMILLSTQPIHTYTQAFPQPGTLAATGLPGDEQARLALQMALYNVLNFSLSDLDANRRGMLTHAQRRTLSARVLWGIIGSFIGLFLSGGLLILGIVSLLDGSSTYPSDMNPIGSFLIGGIIVLLLLTFFLASLYYLTIGAGKRYAAIRYESVQSVEGNLQTHVVGGDTGPDSNESYYYDIGQYSFEVTEAAHSAVIPGLRYRVHYLASSKTLMSIEPLEPPAR